MANILDEIGKTAFGQQDLADYTTFDPSSALTGATGLLPQIGAFNQAIAQQQLGLIPIQNQMRGALYGQAINPLQEAYTSNILSNLNLGSSLPQDLQQEVMRGALQGSAASGFGLSPGGRALVGRDLGLSSYNIGQQRRGEAFNALQAFRAPELRGQLSPTTALDLEMSRMQDQNFAREREAANRNANRAAIIKSIEGYARLGGAVAGEFVGSAFGTKGFGSALSGIGGGMGGGGGGAQFGAGPGQQYVGSGGQVMTSVRAAPYTGAY